MTGQCAVTSRAGRDARHHPGDTVVLRGAALAEVAGRIVPAR